MKTSILLSASLLLVSVATIAQPTIGQINSTAATINSAAYSAANVNSAVNNTGQAVKGTVSTMKEIGSFFKKKEKVAEPVKEVTANTVLLTIAGIDYTKLKVIEDAIKPIEGVKSTTKKFSASGSTIEVAYAGKDDQLWDAIPETIKATLTLTDLGSGVIALEQKK
ncbi:hypothetical protein [Spirosoma fluminis]